LLLGIPLLLEEALFRSLGELLLLLHASLSHLDESFALLLASQLADVSGSYLDVGFIDILLLSATIFKEGASLLVL